MKLFKALLTLIFIAGSFCSFSQVYYSKEDNVYNKDAQIILDYAEGFIKSNNGLFNLSEGDTTFIGGGQYIRSEKEIVVHSIYFMKRSTRFCFGSMVLTADIAFMAKHGRTRVELRKIGYYIVPPGGTSSCSGSGDYESLKASDCCKRADYIVEYLTQRMVKITDEYKKVLKKKSDSSAWGD